MIMVLITKDESSLWIQIFKPLMKSWQAGVWELVKTRQKTLVIGKNYRKHSIKIHTEQLEQIITFKFLGPVISHDRKLDEKIKEGQGGAGRFFF